jgi:hypothetical protein
MGIDGRRPDNATTLVPLAASSRSYRANLTFCYVSLLRGVGQSTGQVVDFIDYTRELSKVDSVIFCKFIEAFAVGPL